MKTKLLLISLIALAGCKSSEKAEQQTLPDKIQSEKPADTPEKIAERAAQTFINAPSLSDDQKQKIMQIYVRVYNDARKVREDIGKSKSLMFKMIATKDYDSKEVNDLKNHIVGLDQKRLLIMFKALEDVKKVVGSGKEKEEIFKHFYDYEYPGKMFSSRRSEWGG